MWLVGAGQEFPPFYRFVVLGRSNGKPSMTIGRKKGGIEYKEDIYAS
jgi:hypothetical protein